MRKLRSCFQSYRLNFHILSVKRIFSSSQRVAHLLPLSLSTPPRLSQILSDPAPPAKTVLPLILIIINFSHSSQLFPTIRTLAALLRPLLKTPGVKAMTTPLTRVLDIIPRSDILQTDRAHPHCDLCLSVCKHHWLLSRLLSNCYQKLKQLLSNLDAESETL